MRSVLAALFFQIDQNFTQNLNLTSEVTGYDKKYG